jgi:hypothetical protein
MMGKIKDKVYNYDENDLKKNNFTLLYKPYSHWSIECQNDYDTMQFAGMGKQLGDL